MKKFNLLFVLLLLFGVLSAQAVQAASSGEPWDTIKDVVTLQFMTKLGFQSSLDPFEGFIRFAILLVLFAVLFKGAELLKLGRNTAIVIALVFSFVSAIFIPGSVLVAAGASYGTVVGMVLLGLPAALFIWGYLVIENKWVRVGLMALMLFMLYQMSAHIGDLASGAGVTSSHFKGVLETVRDYVKYVTWLSWGFLVVAFFSALSSTGGASEHHPNWLGRLGKKVKSIAPGTEEGKQLRHERIEETRLMNDLAVEKEELGLLQEGTARYKDYTQIAVNEIGNTSTVNSKAHAEEFEVVFQRLKTAMDDIDKVQHKWKRTERREVAEFRRLYKELINRGVTGAKNLAAEEKNLLNKYVDVSKNVKDAQNAFAKIEKNHKDASAALLTKYRAGPSGSGSPTTPYNFSTVAVVVRYFAEIKAQLNILKIALIQAESAEKDAVEQTAALAEQVKGKWAV